MALKGDRLELQTDTSFNCSTVAEQGCVAFFNTLGSGIDLDDPNNTLVIPASLTSGTTYYPAGILLNNIVNIDTTRQHLNFHKNEVLAGAHVTILRQGWVVTNQVMPGTTPALGNPVYVGYSGLFTNQNNNAIYPSIKAEWASVKDPDGYAKIYIHMP